MKVILVAILKAPELLACICSFCTSVDVSVVLAIPFASETKSGFANTLLLPEPDKEIGQLATRLL